MNALSRIVVLAAIGLTMFAADSRGYNRTRISGGNEIFWQDASEELIINLNDFPQQSLEDLRFREAVGEWNAQFFNGSRFLFSVSPGTTVETNNNDEISAVGSATRAFFDGIDQPSSVVAVTRWVAHNSGQLIQTDIVFVEMSGWTFDAQMPLCGGGTNFKEVAVHELGHALGLGHENDLPCIMNSVAGNHYLGEGRDITPNADDLAGLRAIYPLPLFSRTDLAAGNHSGHRPPSWLRTGGQFQMPYVVHNLGRHAIENVTIGFYLSADRNLSPTSDVLLGSLTQTIGGGEELIGQLSLLIPERHIPGNYFLGYVIDPSNEVDESDEGNNRTDFCSGVTVTQGERVYVRIAASPSSIQFSVDGAQYAGSHELVWSYGTAHTLSTNPVQLENGLSRFQFVNWGNANQPGNTVTVTALRNTSYVAQFAEHHFLEAAVVGSGSINVPSGWYRDGDAFEITAFANTIPFARWEGSGDGSYNGCLNPATIVVNAPIIQRAVFENNPQTVQIGLLCNDSEGRVLIDGDTVSAPIRLCRNAHSELEVQVLPVQGDREGIRRALLRWSDGDTSTTRRISIGQQARNFSFEYGAEYFLTMEVEGVGSVSPGSGWIDSAASVNIVASSFCGSTFDRWDGSGQGSYDGPANSATLVLVREPLYQKAKFTGGNTPSISVASREIDRESRQPYLGDLDNDSDLDLFIVAENGGVRIQRNDGGSFTDFSGQTGLPSENRNLTCLKLFDVNGDGKLDIYFVGEDGNRLYLGNGIGSFSEDTPTPLRNEGSEGMDAVFIDYDRDGRNDVFLANRRGASKLWRQSEAGVYQEVGVAVFGQLGELTKVTCTDYDRDGFVDLHISSESGDRILRNNLGNGFSDVTDDLRLGRRRGSSGHWSDYDNDGYPDLLLVQDDHARVFRNDQAARLEEVRLPSAGISVIDAQWVDFDNDGRLDIVLIGDDDAPDFFQVLQNRGDDHFERLIREVDLEDDVLEGTRFAALGDLDDDGDFDAITNFPQVELEHRLLADAVCGNHFRVRLRGANHLSPITAVWVSVTSSGGTQHRFIDDGEASFGLGPHSTVSELIIRWPSGVNDVYTNIAANQEIEFWAPTVTDAEDEVHEILPAHFALEQNYPNPFNPETRIAFNIPKPCRVEIVVLNALGQRVTTLMDQDCLAGTHVIDWHGTDDSGSDVASGIYFYRMRTDGSTQTRKMVLLR